MGVKHPGVCLVAWQGGEVIDGFDVTGVDAEVNVEIAAPLELVWDLLADLPLTPAINRETLPTVWLPFGRF